MWSVISLSYGGNIGIDQHTTAFDTVSRLFGMEQQLVEWERLLPSTLTLRQSGEFLASTQISDPSSLALERFRTILTLRHHNVRVLLHRPILVKFLDITGRKSPETDIQEVNLMQQIGNNSVQICVQASMNIIKVVSTIVASNGTHRNLLGRMVVQLVLHVQRRPYCLCGVTSPERSVNERQSLSLCACLLNGPA